jgi:hypothetical protein
MSGLVYVESLDKTHHFLQAQIQLKVHGPIQWIQESHWSRTITVTVSNSTEFAGCNGSSDRPLPLCSWAFCLWSIYQGRLLLLDHTRKSQQHVFAWVVINNIYRRKDLKIFKRVPLFSPCNISILEIAWRTLSELLESRNLKSVSFTEKYIPICICCFKINELWP